MPAVGLAGVDADAVVDVGVGCDVGVVLPDVEQPGVVRPVVAVVMIAV